MTILGIRYPSGSITPEQGEAIIASALYNHDTNSDLVTLTAEIAMVERRTITFAEVRDLCVGEGVLFDAEGWMVA